MTKGYRPRLDEIVLEIWRKDAQAASRAVAGNLKEFVISMLSVGGYTATWQYYLPTEIRMGEIIEEKVIKVPPTNYPLAQHMGRTIGFLAGLFAEVTQVVVYGVEFFNGHPEVLAIPVATNATSCIYELGRLAYRNSKQQLIERHNTEQSGAK